MNSFFAQLNDGDVPANIVQGTLALCKGIQAGDLQGAQQVVVQMMTAQYLDWMPHLKRLIMQAMLQK